MTTTLKGTWERAKPRTLIDEEGNTHCGVCHGEQEGQVDAPGFDVSKKCCCWNGGGTTGGASLSASRRYFAAVVCTPRIGKHPKQIEEE